MFSLEPGSRGIIMFAASSFLLAHDNEVERFAVSAPVTPSVCHVELDVVFLEAGSEVLDLTRYCVPYIIA